MAVRADDDFRLLLTVPEKSFPWLQSVALISLDGLEAFGYAVELEVDPFSRTVLFDFDGLSAASPRRKIRGAVGAVRAVLEHTLIDESDNEALRDVRVTYEQSQPLLGRDATARSPAVESQLQLF